MSLSAVTFGNDALECIIGIFSHGERLPVVLDQNRLFSNEERGDIPF